MKKFFSTFLKEMDKSALITATSTFPGAGIIIAGVGGLFDKDEANNVEAITQIETGLVTFLEAAKAKELADETKLAECIEDTKALFDKYRAAFTKPLVDPT